MCYEDNPDSVFSHTNEPGGLGEDTDPYDLPDDFDPENELLELPFCGPDDPDTPLYDESTGTFRVPPRRMP